MPPLPPAMPPLQPAMPLIPPEESDESPPPMREFVLSQRDQSILLGGDWLTDTHINGAHTLLRKQYRSQNGLCNTIVLAKMMRWDSTPQDFVQIVNLSSQHWLCVSNKLTSPGVVDVYDSMPAYSLGSHTLRQQIASILKTSESSFTIRFVNVQRQNGGSDCALFAVMFAEALCNGKDPHTLSVNQGQMRSHLHRCFEQGEILEFPAASKPRRLGRQRIAYTKEVPVFCSCRLSWYKVDTVRGSLIQCTLCKEWYHPNCAKVDGCTFNQPNSYKWYCSNCIDV